MGLPPLPMGEEMNEMLNGVNCTDLFIMVVQYTR